MLSSGGHFVAARAGKAQGKDRKYGQEHEHIGHVLKRERKGPSGQLKKPLKIPADEVSLRRSKFDQ